MPADRTVSQAKAFTQSRTYFIVITDKPALLAGNIGDAVMSPNHSLPPQRAAQIEPGDLVTEIEAAAILSTAVRTLRNWRALKKGPRYRKIGLRMVRYLRADLASFQKVMPGDDEAAA